MFWNMTRLIVYLTPLLFLSCKSKANPQQEISADFTLTFGSCNRTELPNLLWDDVLQTHPDVWIWGGDIVYADTDSIPLLQQAYRAQAAVPGYRELEQTVPIMGTWDDHDYGLNDGGAEFSAKAQSQQAFLDFLQVDSADERRRREGVYYARRFETPKGSIKVILLDTRYHRSDLTPDTTGVKRYLPTLSKTATMLGDAQWNWLEAELQQSTADFNVIMSSIQVLSDQHGFETWGNMPLERNKLLQVIHDSGAKGVILLSGDRHISEFSAYSEPNWAYPIIDFTSSGLTHAYSGFTEEPNPFRLGEVVPKISFGVIQFDFSQHRANFQIVGDTGEVLGDLIQVY